MPTLVTTRTHFIQSACLLAARGFYFWCSDTVRPERVVEDWKLITRHRANAGRIEQLAQRRRGEPRSRVLVVDTGEEKWPWWLLATAPLPDEAMADLRDRRTRLKLGKFELVRDPGPNGATWTWRCVEKEWAKLCADAIHKAQARDPRPAQMIAERMARWPSAGGLNRQRRELFHRMWRTSRGRVKPPPIIYHRFLSTDSKTSTTADAKMRGKQEQTKTS
jgi:hypothetical protein